MEINQILEKYSLRLENNPKYQYGTVQAYKKAISEMLNLYGENPSIEQLNTFISVKCRKRQPYVKYAIKEYFSMYERMHEYHKLVQAKVRSPTRQKTFLNHSQLKMIIDGINKDLHRVIGLIQAATATRAAEVITIERKRIRKEQLKIRIQVMGKGDKPRNVCVSYDLWPSIEPYYIEPKKYLFFSKEADNYSKEHLYKKTYTLYKRYLESLKESAKKFNIEISTHDLRRSVANLIKLKSVDPRVTQKVLGHSSLTTTERYIEDDTETISDALLDHQKNILSN